MKCQVHESGVSFARAVNNYLDGNAVILVPDSAIMDPYIAPRHIKAVSVEGCQVDDAMMVLVSSPCTRIK